MSDSIRLALSGERAAPFMTLPDNAASRAATRRVNLTLAQLATHGVALDATETGDSLVMPSLASFWFASNIVRVVEAAFAQLPAQLRAAFHNDPFNFVAAINDPAMRPALVAAGLLRPQLHPATDPGPPPGGPQSAPKPAPYRDPPPRPALPPLPRAAADAAQLLRAFLAAVTAAETTAPAVSVHGTEPRPESGPEMPGQCPSACSQHCPVITSNKPGGAPAGDVLTTP